MTAPSSPPASKGSSPIPPELGEFVEEFGPDSANLKAGVILTWLCLFAAVTGYGWVVWKIARAGGNLPWSSQHGDSWADVGLLALLSLIPLVSGIYFKFYVALLRKRRPDACPAQMHRRQSTHPPIVPPS